MHIHTLAVNIVRMITPYGYAYWLHDKAEGVIFVAKIGKIVCTSSPKEPELALIFVAAEPVVLHLHGFGLTLDDVIIRNINCSGVITLDGRFGMRPTHLDKGLKNLDHGSGADEEAVYFGFGSRGHDKLDYLGDSEDRAISGMDRSVFGVHGVGTSTAAGFSYIKVGSI